MMKGTERDECRGLRRGDVVEVRDEDVIRASLDADGKLAGLPFMPEMGKYCGRRFRVHGRLEKVYLDGRRQVAQLKNTVLLSGVRCNGSAHGGCQAGCFILWKEAWLKPSAGLPSPPAENGLPDSHTTPPHDDETYSCQATELVGAAQRMSRWQLWRYAPDYSTGTRNLRELFQMVVLTALNKVRRRLGWHLYGKVCGERTKTPEVRLGLRPGELVRVKGRDEIKATLDRVGRNRGLVFTPDMVRFCDGTYRVARRVERFVVEWSGEMCRMSNTVALEGATCSGIAVGCCGRDCYHLWREAWLERVPSPDAPQGSGAAPANESPLCSAAARHRVPGAAG